MIVSQSHVSALARFLDVAAQRNDVIAQNVANVNTPAYRALDVRFEQQLSAAMWSDGPAVPQARPRIVEADGGTPRNDGNNVDIDQEMARLHKNTILVQLYNQVMAIELSQYRAAIQGR